MSEVKYKSVTDSASENTAKPEIQKVAITRVEIPFGNLLELMVSIGLASIPAAIVVALVYYIFISVLGVLAG